MKENIYWALLFVRAWVEGKPKSLYTKGSPESSYSLPFCSVTLSGARVYQACVHSGGHPIMGASSSKHHTCKIPLFFCFVFSNQYQSSNWFLYKAESILTMSSQLRCELTSEKERQDCFFHWDCSSTSSNLNSLSLKIFSEKSTIGYIILHKCVKIKSKMIMKVSSLFYLFIYFVSFFSLRNLLHADFDGMSSTKETSRSQKLQGNRISKEMAKKRSKWKIFSITYKVTENKDIREPSRAEYKAMRFYLL